PESLILIPDISGFTEFVNNTEITHSQHIISEYLLFSNHFAKEIDSADFSSRSWVKFSKGVTEYKDLGKIQYDFILLNQLK
ncbi:MAG: hypothetical protein PVH48_10815, partial [Cyclobacteriaceae bacterium]